MQAVPMQFLAALTVAVALIAGAAPSARAQAQGQPTNEQLFVSFLGSPAYANFIDRALQQVEPAPLKAECAVLTVREQPRYAVVRPANFTVTAGQGAITDGVWVAWVPVDRCGTATVRRILVVVAGPNNLTPSRMLPGQFGGDLRLEADVQRTVVPLFQEMAECADEKAVHVRDIKMLAATQQAWTEQWFAKACNKDVAILVKYTRAGNAINFETELPPDAPPGAALPPGPPTLVPAPTQPVPGLRPGLPAAPPPGLPTRPGGVAK